ncbi:MAG: glycoside hydrolase family 15 protein [Actinomycetota bacterium]
MQAQRSASGPEARPVFLPLERYGLIGDCGTAALVSDDGSIDWLCLPRFDSNPVFGRLLDPAGGHFSLRPREPFTAQRAYLADTAVLATTYTTPSGRATVYDFFPALPFAKKRRRLWPFRYLVRRIEGEAGSVVFDVEIAPGASFGDRPYRLRAKGSRLAAGQRGRAVFFECSTPFRIDGDVARAELIAEEGRRSYVTASEANRSIGVLPAAGEYAEQTFHETVDYWKRWSEQELAGDRAPAIVRRSAITLKLLTYAPSGGVVAAPTTSLPEAPGADRNWDYRYVWVRDASRTIIALFDLGYHDEAHAYMYWVTNAAHLTHPKIHTLYGVHGEHWVRERDLEGLRGYLDSRPVRVGNGAGEQLQLDNWGEVVEAAYVFAERSGEIDRDMWRALRALVSFVAKRWREPDAGIWEMRGEPQQFVHSKVMCWVALDRGISMARDFGFRAPIEDWERERDSLKRAVLEHGFDAVRNTFTQVFDKPDLDAALLEIPRVRFLEPDDPRITGTIDAVRGELGRADLVYRYRRDDGLGGTEGAFVACSFWLVQALALNGRTAEAREVFDQACRRTNELGLLSEEIDPDTGRFLGNFPQGLSHIALINAAAALHEAEKGEPRSTNAV